MILAQISDMHVQPEGVLTFGEVDTAGHLARTVDHLIALSPPADAVLVTGDITNDGKPEQYAEVKRQFKRLKMPVYPIPGNHDERVGLRVAFPQLEHLCKERFIQYVVEDHPVRIVALDTVVTGKPHGALCTERLQWLEQTLATAPDRPTVLMMHHPPVETGIEHMDEMMCLEGNDALGEIVQDNTQIERILCGHVHRPIHLRWFGTVVSTMPGTAHQVHLDLNTSSRPRYRMDPPGIQLHVWRPRAGLISHLDFPGDYGPANYFPHAATD